MNEPHENNTKDRGPWMLTYSGGRFYPLDPRKEEFRIVDIARSISKTCRYNGHPPYFYSVAEHCVHLAQHFLDRDDVNSAKWAWAHDGAESYIGDMIRPIKWMFPDYTNVERKIEEVYFDQVLNLGGVYLPENVKEADTLICNDERFQLWENVLFDGKYVVDSYGHRDSIKLGITVHAWDHKTAYSKYMLMYEKLFNG